MVVIGTWPFDFLLPVAIFNYHWHCHMPRTRPPTTHFQLRSALPPILLTQQNTRSTSERDHLITNHLSGVACCGDDGTVLCSGRVSAALSTKGKSVSLVCDLRITFGADWTPDVRSVSFERRPSMVSLTDSRLEDVHGNLKMENSLHWHW